jgi:hypothetical protein
VDYRYLQNVILIEDFGCISIFDIPIFDTNLISISILSIPILSIEIPSKVSLVEGRVRQSSLRYRYRYFSILAESSRYFSIFFDTQYRYRVSIPSIGIEKVSVLRLRKPIFFFKKKYFFRLFGNLFSNKCNRNLTLIALIHH